MRGYVKGTSAAGEMQTIRESAARAFAAIRACADAEQAFRDASALGELGVQLRTEAGDFRAYLAATLLDANALSLAELAGILHLSKSRTDQLVRTGREKGETVSDPGTEVEPPRVALAIIATDRGVLVERRNDKIPPWTFPGGDIMEGESPAAAAARRVLAETGAEVTGTELIGRRIHPRTGRVMIYLKTTVAGTDIELGDPDDLAEVKWASIPEVLGLMPDIYPPVKAYLESLT